MSKLTIDSLKRKRTGLLGLVLLTSCGHARTVSDVRTISVTIHRSPRDVYDFASDIRNLPKWATGVGDTIRYVDGEWVAEGPLGRVKVRIAERNDLGVLDQDVTPESGTTVHNPLRVVPNGAGSEVMFTLFRQPGVSDEKLSQDAKWVEKDLNLLKSLLER